MGGKESLSWNRSALLMNDKQKKERNKMSCLSLMLKNVANKSKQNVREISPPKIVC